MLENRYIAPDKNGDTLGIPLEMLIISVVMLISIPIVFSYSSMYIRSQVESDLRVELEKFIDTIEEIERSEIGNRRTFSLDINDHPLARISHVRVGGEDIHLRSTIRYSLKNREEVVLSLGGLEVSARDETGFMSFELPLNGETVLIEKDHVENVSFIEVSQVNDIA